MPELKPRPNEKFDVCSEKGKYVLVRIIKDTMAFVSSNERALDKCWIFCGSLIFEDIREQLGCNSPGFVCRGEDFLLRFQISTSRNAKNSKFWKFPKNAWNSAIWLDTKCDLYPYNFCFQRQMVITWRTWHRTQYAIHAQLVQFHARSSVSSTLEH